MRRAKEQHQSYKCAVLALAWYGDRRLRGGSSRRGATNANNVDATELGDVAQDTVDIEHGTENEVKNIDLELGR